MARSRDIDCADNFSFLYENDRCVIVLKAKTSRRKWVHIVAIYRQWHVLGPNPNKEPNSNETEDQVARFHEIAIIIENIVGNNYHTDILILQS